MAPIDWINSEFRHLDAIINRRFPSVCVSKVARTLDKAPPPDPTPPTPALDQLILRPPSHVEQTLSRVGDKNPCRRRKKRAVGLAQVLAVRAGLG